MPPPEKLQIWVKIYLHFQTPMEKNNFQKRLSTCWWMRIIHLKRSSFIFPLFFLFLFIRPQLKTVHFMPRYISYEFRPRCKIGRKARIHNILHFLQSQKTVLVHTDHKTLSDFFFQSSLTRSGIYLI